MSVYNFTAPDPDPDYERLPDHVLDALAVTEPADAEPSGSSWDDLDADPTAEARAVAQINPTAYELTDVGNAARFADSQSGAYRYVPAWGTWLRWDGTRWRRDTLGDVTEAAKTMVQDMLTAVAAIGDSDQRKKAAAWALRSQDARRIDALLRLARTDPVFAIEADQLDANRWLLNCMNCTVNLATGAAHTHDPADNCTKLAPVRFDPDADAPRWRHFLATVLPDPEVREFLLRALGYTLTGDVREQVIIIGTGRGSNGKSVLVDTIRTLMGDYAQAGDPDLIMAKDAAHPTGQARLQGARFVVVSESDDHRRLAEATVKRLTGSDQLVARYMRQDFFEFTPSHKLWLVTNHKPKVSGTDHAIWRRIRLIPFDVVIADEDQDKELPAKLLAEGAGILADLVAACRRWAAQGLTSPLAVTLATSAYRADEDLLGAFLADCCDLTNPDTHTTSADLYAAYKRWAAAAGEDAMTQRALAPLLRERGLDSVKHGTVRWLGVRLTTEPQGSIL